MPVIRGKFFSLEESKDRKAQNQFHTISPSAIFPPVADSLTTLKLKIGVVSLIKRAGIFRFFQYYIQHCFICRPSDSTVSEDAGVEPRTVATSSLPDRRSNHSARSHPPVLWSRKYFFRLRALAPWSHKSEFWLRLQIVL
jgi:hypothetical protein